MRPRPSLPEVSVGCGGGVAVELQSPALQRGGAQPGHPGPWHPGLVGLNNSYVQCTLDADCPFLPFYRQGPGFLCSWRESACMVCSTDTVLSLVCAR